MPGRQEIYTVYYYDQLCKLWAQRMRNRATGISKVWVREKRKLFHLDKVLIAKPPTDYYKLRCLQIGESKREKLERRRVKHLIAQKKYREKNRAIINKKDLDRYYKNIEQRRRNALERYHKLKKAA